MALDNTDILLLEKLFHHGKRLERTRIYEFLEPWHFNGNNVVEVQNAGKRIGEFIGLSNLTFIISYSEQGENTAGHIELNNNNDQNVFIEIDEKYKSEDEIILAILAHEICHKLIHINNLTLFGYENEILTDVATIYTGLGKLTLNGCEKTKFDTGIQLNSDGKTITTTTTTTTTTNHSVGYLSKDQLAFVYNVVCNMRRIPKEYSVKGLKANALAAVRNIRYYNDADLFYNDYVFKLVNDKLNEFNLNYHKVSAETIKLIKTMHHNFELVINSEKEIHKKIKFKNENFLISTTENINPESLNYLKNLILLIEIDNFYDLFIDEMNKFSSFNEAITSFLNTNRNSFSVNPQNREIFYNIECPVCENKMRVKADNLVRVKCSKCKYSFLVDNKLIEKELNKKSTSSNDLREVKRSFKDKIRDIISIIKK